MPHQPSFPDENAITPFAVTNYRDIRRIFGIKQKNRRGHMYVIGKTGAGKSTLIRNMVISDIRDGHGVALIDPHGDLAEAVLDYIPRHRIPEVLYVHPGDLGYPVAFNPLASVLKEYRPLVASGLLGVFRKIWWECWGPRLEHILRHALLTLMEYPPATLLDVPRLLTQKEFRAEALRYVSDPELTAFWQEEFEKYPARFRAEAIAPILNKLSQLVLSGPLRNILGQPNSSFRFRRLMDEGRIVICNLSKGQIGEDCSALLGSMLVAQIQLAAQSRATVEASRRTPFYLYVDEVHNFLTLSFSDILSEARKYGLHLVLAHQYISQLDTKIRAAIFGNIGSIIAFRVGAEDAQYLAREFAPVFDEEALTTLPNHHIYLKLMVDGLTSKPFSAVTLPPLTGKNALKQDIIAASRARYARPRAEVEELLRKTRRGRTTRSGSQARLFTS